MIADPADTVHPFSPLEQRHADAAHTRALAVEMAGDEPLWLAPPTPSALDAIRSPLPTREDLERSLARLVEAAEDAGWTRGRYADEDGVVPAGQEGAVAAEQQLVAAEYLAAFGLLDALLVAVTR